MSILENGTWVLVADGQKALILENLTDGEDPHLDVTDEETKENPQTQDWAANRRGRVQQSANVGSHAYSDTDWHEFEKDRFAKDLADILYKKAHAGEFDRIVLVASPQVLGVLRDELHDEVKSKIVGEIDKTLTNHPVNEIEEIVKSELKAA
ncbi:Host attachment protein [Alphaproteobacteria bacterium GH1-50]|uniref:Host attachment protein n=1 Tax=Kangsaoukella pontilimi TaxID=2691042 RepID=A0A7C9MVP8_9RHOB|nr:host attachment family protein [Kangsaoukella pontilimi]MXQ06994.1 Host attachment protein [Kangsaoukella pontilimi]